MRRGGKAEEGKGSGRRTEDRESERKEGRGGEGERYRRGGESHICVSFFVIGFVLCCLPVHFFCSHFFFPVSFFSCSLIVLPPLTCGTFVGMTKKKVSKKKQVAT